MKLKNVKLTISNEKGVILGYVDISGKNFNSYSFSPEIHENLDTVDEIRLHSRAIIPIQECMKQFNQH